MILNIRGTNGAGKTHLVRRLMDRLGDGSNLTCQHPTKGKEFTYGCKFGGVVFMGRYDVQNGGCDTLKWKGDAEWLEGKICEWAATGSHAIFEGLIASKWATSRYLNMKKAAEFHAVLLSTTEADCLESVNARRVARGVTEPVNPQQLHDKFAEALSKMSKDRWAGLTVHHMSRDDAYTFCCEKLGLVP